MRPVDLEQQERGLRRRRAASEGCRVVKISRSKRCRCRGRARGRIKGKGRCLQVVLLLCTRPRSVGSFNGLGQVLRISARVARQPGLRLHRSSVRSRHHSGRHLCSNELNPCRGRNRRRNGPRQNPSGRRRLLVRPLLVPRLMQAVVEGSTADIMRGNKQIDGGVSPANESGLRARPAEIGWRTLKAVRWG